LSTESREVAMKNVAEYRALASLCRQTAAYNPDKSWHLLGQAERWEHLAEQELASHFKECNVNRPVYFTESQATGNVDGSRWETIAAA
jgi:hypothetical protein